MIKLDYDYDFIALPKIVLKYRPQIPNYVYRVFLKKPTIQLFFPEDTCYLGLPLHHSKFHYHPIFHSTR